MGRTIPSFRLALEMEERKWELYRNALDKQDRKEIDEMFVIPRRYISACSYTAQTVRLHPILMLILLHCYMQLTDCEKQIKQIMISIGIEGEIFYSNEPISIR
jgi:hypothetical protein